MFKSVSHYGGFLVLVLSVFSLGCPRPAADPKPKETGQDHGGHAHPSHGPHGGDLIELGNEEYHGELLHDDKTGKVTIYILDGQAKDEVSVSVEGVVLNAIVAGQPTQFKLTPPEGSTSGFELTSAELVQALDEHDAKVKLNVTIDGTPFSGAVAHDHDHEHGHKHE